eukprot:350893-Hanusia_phi.AAC.1
MDYKALMIDSPQFLSVSANSSISSFEISFKFNFNLCGIGFVIVEGFPYTKSGPATFDSSFIESVIVGGKLLTIAIKSSECIPAERLVTVTQPVTDGRIPVSSMGIKANGYLRNGCSSPRYVDMPLFSVDISSLTATWYSYWEYLKSTSQLPSGFVLPSAPGAASVTVCSTCVETNAEYTYNITLEFRCSAASNIDEDKLQTGIKSLLCKSTTCVATASLVSQATNQRTYAVHISRSWYNGDQAATTLRGISQDSYFQSQFGDSICSPLISAVSMGAVANDCSSSGTCTGFTQLSLGSISFGGQAAISSLSLTEQSFMLKFLADSLGMNMMDISVDFTGGTLTVIYSQAAASAAAAAANASYYASLSSPSTSSGPLLATSVEAFQAQIVGAIRGSKNISALLAATYQVSVAELTSAPLPAPASSSSTTSSDGTSGSSGTTSGSTTALPPGTPPGAPAPVPGGSCVAPPNLTFAAAAVAAVNITPPAPPETSPPPVVAQINFESITQSTFLPCANNTINVCFRTNVLMDKETIIDDAGETVYLYSKITISGFGTFMTYAGVTGSSEIMFGSHDSNNFVVNVENVTASRTYCFSFMVKNPELSSCTNLSMQAYWQNLNQTASDHLTPGQAGTVCDQNANLNLCSLSSVSPIATALTVRDSTDNPCMDNQVIVKFNLNVPLHSCNPGSLILTLTGLGNTLTPSTHNAASDRNLRFNGLEVNGNFSSSDGLLRFEVPSSMSTSDEACHVQNITFTMLNLNTSRMGASVQLDFADAFTSIGSKALSNEVSNKPPLYVQAVTLTAIMAQNSSWPGSLNMITVTLSSNKVLPVQCKTTLVINNLDGACFENECVGTGNLTLVGSSVFDAVWKSVLLSDSTRSSVTLSVNQDVDTSTNAEIFSFMIHNPVKSQGSPKVIFTGHGVE